MRGLVLAEGGERLEALGADRAAINLVGVVDVQVLVEVALRREVLSALHTPEMEVGPSGSSPENEHRQNSSSNFWGF